ncbi:unnamed protein product [Schistocephalus solidus]|uniref:C2H2-type domain-containing protein n=1 Tax=Schistocephalus solidus TaxID=70667 RepID=A0A183SFH3_SCHSO|nr:unnamed protein product [Schistocephalus solidus]
MISSRLPHPHSWHQFHYSHYHRDHIPLLIACYPHHRNHHRLRLLFTTTISDGESLLSCTQCDRTFTSRLIACSPHHRNHHRLRLHYLHHSTISDGDSLLNCPQCDRTFTSRTGLVGHLRIHHTETGEPVPGAPTHSRDRRLHCPQCPRIFTHRMGLFGQRIHDSGIHRNADNTDTPCTPSAPPILTATATPTNMNDIPPASTDFSYPHCARNFNSRIGLIGHLQIHRTEAVDSQRLHVCHQLKAKEEEGGREGAGGDGRSNPVGSLPSTWPHFQRAAATDILKIVSTTAHNGTDLSQLVDEKRFKCERESVRGIEREKIQRPLPYCISAMRLFTCDAVRDYAYAAMLHVPSSTGRTPQPTPSCGFKAREPPSWDAAQEIQ